MTEAFFEGTCVGLPANLLDEFDDSSREITFETFRQNVGAEVVKDINRGMCPTIQKDWHVRFEKGKFGGKRAYCMFHSAIHHIWTIG